MVNLYNPTEDDFFGVDTLLEMVDLEPSDFEQATRLTQALGDTVDSEQSYQAYQNILASIALARWFEMQGDLTIEAAYSTAQHWLERTCCLKVGDFRVYGLAVSHLFDETLDIPGEVIDDPDLACHLYTVVEVSEEDASAIIRGFLRYDQIQRCQQRGRVAMDWNTMGYELPVDWVNFEARDLFLYLRCADPTTFGLPPVSTLQAVEGTPSVFQTTQALAQSAKRLVWEVRDPISQTVEVLTNFISMATFLEPAQSLTTAAWDQRWIETLIREQQLDIPQSAQCSADQGFIQHPPSQVRIFTWPDETPTQDSPTTNEHNLWVVWIANKGYTFYNGFSLTVSGRECTYKHVPLESSKKYIHSGVVKINPEDVTISLKKADGTEVNQWTALFEA